MRTEVSNLAGRPIEDLQQVSAALGLARFHPRIHRNILGVQRARHAEAWSAASTSTALLLRELGELFSMVHPHPDNYGTYGHRLRQLLILACTEVEASWAGTLDANGKAGRLTTNDYVRLLEPMRLREWTIEWVAHPGLGHFTPFGKWDAARPTASLGWFDAYNKTKHNRELHLKEATLGMVLDAIAGCLVMLAAQFGPDVLVADVPPSLAYRLTNTPKWSAQELYFGPMTGGGLWRDQDTFRWESRPLSL